MDPALAAKTVRAVGTRFVIGTGGGGGGDHAADAAAVNTCEPFAYAGANVWDLMDTARYPTLRWRVDAKLDGLRREGVNVVRTWGFSLGKGETEELRAMRLHVSPDVYDESVFEAGPLFKLTRVFARFGTAQTTQANAWFCFWNKTIETDELIRSTE